MKEEFTNDIRKQTLLEGWGAGFLKWPNSRGAVESEKVFSSAHYH